MIKIDDTIILNTIIKKLAISAELIIDIYSHKEIYLVYLKDYETSKLERFPCNLLALNKYMEIIWFAELPESRMRNDGYWKVDFSTPIIAYSNSSFKCEIDVESGRILSWDFYK